VGRAIGKAKGLVAKTQLEAERSNFEAPNNFQGPKVKYVSNSNLKFVIYLELEILYSVLIWTLEFFTGSEVPLALQYTLSPILASKCNKEA